MILAKVCFQVKGRISGCTVRDYLREILVGHTSKYYVVFIFCATMADDFEFDDFDDEEGHNSSKALREEKKCGNNSPDRRDAGKKTRLHFDNGYTSNAVNEGRNESSGSEAESLTPSSSFRDNASIYSVKYEENETARKPVDSQISSSSNRSVTTSLDDKDESPDNSSSRYYSARHLSDGSETNLMISPGKRVHFRDDTSSHVSSRDLGGVPSDCGASDISVSQNTGEHGDYSISTKSNVSCGASTQSQASLSRQSTCSISSGKPSTPPRQTKRSPIKAALGKRSRLSNLREKPWIRDLDDDLESESQNTRKRRIMPRPLFEKDEKLLIGSIGRSTQSLRDAGSSQLLNDEFVDMCNTLGANLTSIGSDREPFQIASRLLDLLSSQENRRALFLEGQIIRKDADSPLEAVLNLLGSFDEISSLEVIHRSPERKTARLSLFPSSVRPSENGIDHKTTEKSISSSRDEGGSQQFLDAIGMIAYLLAFDCTVSDAGISESSARNARDIRYEIIAHPRALRGILNLIIIDPLVSRLRARPAEASDDLHDESVASSPALSSSGSVAASSVSSSYSVADPTKMGRFRKKRQQLFDEDLCSVPEQTVADVPSESYKRTRKFKPASPGKDDGFDFDEFTTKKRIEPVQEKLDKVSCRVIDSLPSPSSTPDTTPMHTCAMRTQSGHRIVGDVSHSIPLVALSRIVRGKMEWCEKSCLDIEVPDPSAREFGTREPSVDEEGFEDDDNPLLQTNNLLGRSGCLPLLSKTLTETLAAILWALEQRSPCQQCISYLYDKLSSLTSLVDEACLLNGDNREQLCREGYTYEFDCGLVAGLTTFLRVLDVKHLIFGGRSSFKNRIWDEMVLETLRSLTSLTHDNAYAARDFMKTKLRSRFDRENNDLTSVEVISRVLHSAAVRGKATGGHSSQSNKLRYDSVIFCLNILTNCVESSEGALATPLLTVSLPAQLNGNGRHSRTTDTSNFISWLAAWLVGETESFRDAICAFGSESTHSQRRLETSENDQLVTAGNGFVLLASILAISADDLVQKNSADNNTFDQNNVHELILTNLPGNDYKSKVGFMKNLLTIFCNFYQVSIGDLSVAVTGPIKGLIRKLDSISLPVLS